MTDPQVHLRAVFEAVSQHLAIHADGRPDCGWPHQPCEECQPWAERMWRNWDQIPTRIRLYCNLSILVLRAHYAITKRLRWLWT